jgi:hypothetical protein
VPGPNALDNRGRLFAQSPQPPEGYRPGQTDRDKYRLIADGPGGLPPQNPYPLLDPRDEERAQLMIQRIVALLQNTDLSPLEIVKKSLTIAGDICIYSNQNHVIEVLGDRSQDSGVRE